MTEHTTEEVIALRKALKRQAGASRVLRKFTLDYVQHLKDKDRTNYTAAKTLDSEREANAILTDENEALRKRVDELTKQKQEIALQALSDAGQAFDAHEAQLKAEARVEELEGVLEKITNHRKDAHDYDDDVGHVRRDFDEIDVLFLEEFARQALKGDQPFACPLNDPDCTKSCGAYHCGN